MEPLLLLAAFYMWCETEHWIIGWLLFFAAFEVK
jgi:hypothetical protein